MESATGRAETGHSIMHHSIGFGNVRGWASKELIAFDYKVERDSGFNREARVARILEELHYRHLSNCQSVSGQMWEHTQHFEASQRRSIRLLQKHAFVEISCGAQRGTHKWLQVHFSTLWIRHHLINRDPKDHSTYFDSTVPKDTAGIPLMDSTWLYLSNRIGRINFAKSDPA